MAVRHHDLTDGANADHRRIVALSTLGLSAGAQRSLVEIAYWHQVERCRAADVSESGRAHRLIQLNDARLLLSEAEPTRAHPLPLLRPSAAPSTWQRIAVCAPPLAATVAFALIARRSGMAWPLVVAGSVGMLASAGVVESAIVTLLGRPPVRRAVTSSHPFEELGIDPAADDILAEMVYRHLRMRALSAGDGERVLLLDLAYSRVCAMRAESAAAMGAPPPANESSVPPPAGVIAFVEPATPPAVEPSAILVSAVAAAVVDIPAVQPPVVQTATDESAVIQPAAVPPAVVAEPIVSEGQMEAPDEGKGGVLTGAGLTAAAAPAKPATPVRRPDQEAGSIVVSLHGSVLYTTPLASSAVFSIGAGRWCHIRLASEDAGCSDSVGDEHARLTVRPSRVLFHHVAEGCVSLINGEPAVWATLEPGDEIAIGGFVCTYRAD